MTSPNYQPLLTRLTDPATITLDVSEVAELLGISRPHCYHTIAETGNVAGIAVIRVGSRIKVPAAPLRALLGITAAPMASDQDYVG
jgi:hypothetical protein